MSPISTLRELRGKVFSIVDLVQERDKGTMRLVVRGIQAEIDWCIDQLEAAHEGERHFDLDALKRQQKQAAAK